MATIPAIGEAAGAYFRKRLLERSESADVYLRQFLGFALFLIWNYGTLYSSILIVEYGFAGSQEEIWMFAALFECFAGLAYLALALKRALARSKVFGAIGALCAAAGTVVIFFAFSSVEQYQTIFPAGALLCGVGCTFLGIIWGAKFTEIEEGTIELYIALSFGIAWSFFAVMYLANASTIFVTLLIVAMPLASAAFAFQNVLRAEDQPPSVEEHPVHSYRSAAARYGKFFILIATLWIMSAYLRTVSAPSFAENSYLHLLIPFTIAGVVALILCRVFSATSRLIDFTLAIRWTLPFGLFSATILCSGQSEAVYRALAYAVNLIGMIGLQFVYWTTLPKYLRRTGHRADIVFAMLMVAEGIGIFAGTEGGMYLRSAGIWPEWGTFATLAIVSAALTVCMVGGFNPRWHFSIADAPLGDAGEDEPEEEPRETDDASESDLEAAVEERAQEMAERYGLIKRELQVAELLIAGRSRPYIRDALFISLNTVHAHARNIMAKCDVHSQQDLIDLAWEKEPDERE